MMIHPRGRRPDDARAGTADLDAKVDIVEGGRKHRVEAAHRLEQIAAQQQAGCGQAGIVLLQRTAPEVAKLTAPHAAERVIGDVADAEQDAGVLHEVRRIIEQRAGRADAVEADARDELRQPITVDHRHVVVEEAKQLPARFRGAAIVDLRIVEGQGRVLHGAHA